MAKPQFPSPWHRKGLGELLASVNAGVSSNAGDRPAKLGEHGILTLTAVVSGQFNPHANKVIEKGFSANRGPSLVSNTVLISRSNTLDLVGRTVFVERDYPHLHLPDLLWALQVRDTNEIEPHWLHFYLSAPTQRRALQSIASGTSANMKKLSIGRLRRISVDLPPIAEQRCHVTLLRSWDDAEVQTLELLRARRKLKRGLLQQLLTGQRRFPEFRKQLWVERPLSAFFTEVDVSNANGGETLVLSCTKLYGIISQMERFERRIASASISHYKVVKRGQLVYDPMLLWDRSIGFVKGYDSGVVSPAYATFAINSELADQDFFEALFDSHFMRHQYKVISKGTNQRRRKAEPRDFLGVRVLVPPTVEQQRRIGEFVRTCDQELDGLKALHSALKEQKKGLMQKLLTGQVRVPASMLKETSHA